MSGRVSNPDFSRDRCELYQFDKDLSESQDLAQSNPAKLDELKALFDAEAKGIFVGGEGIDPTAASGGRCLTKAELGIDVRELGVPGFKNRK